MNQLVFVGGLALRIGLGLYTPMEQFYGRIQAFGRPGPAIEHPAPDTALLYNLGIFALTLEKSDNDTYGL